MIRQIANEINEVMSIARRNTLGDIIGLIRRKIIVVYQFLFRQSRNFVTEKNRFSEIWVSQEKIPKGLTRKKCKPHTKPLMAV